MKVQCVILAIVLICISMGSHASSLSLCSDIEVDYIKSLFSSKKLEPEFAIDYDFEPNLEQTFDTDTDTDTEQNKPRMDKICELRNELISDGLSFTLFKQNKLLYIRVNNGFDGSYTMYGPFER